MSVNTNDDVDRVLSANDAPPIDYTSFSNLLSVGDTPVDDTPANLGRTDIADTFPLIAAVFGSLRAPRAALPFAADTRSPADTPEPAVVAPAWLAEPPVPSGGEVAWLAPSLLPVPLAATAPFPTVAINAAKQLTEKAASNEKAVAPAVDLATMFRIVTEDRPRPVQAQPPGGLQDVFAHL